MSSCSSEGSPLSLPASLSAAAASIGVDTTCFLPSEAALDAHVAQSWRFFEGMGSPRYVCAPMVHQSNLPFRSVVRKYGMPLCYTPMINSGAYLRSLTPEKHFNTSPQDKPLVAQLAGDDPAILLEAAKRVLAQGPVDAIDVNLGCPQGIARKGHYGSFLLEDTQIVQSIVSTLSKGLPVPVTCKIRVRLNDPTGEKTIAMAMALQNSGCSLLTLHGRTRDMKKEAVEETDWAIIKRVKRALRIPVFANGSIETRADADVCLQQTGVDGVMISEALLCWPAMVAHPVEADMPYPVDMADEVIAAHVTHTGHEVDLRPHLFKILFRELAFHTNLRSALGMPGGGADLLAATRRLRFEQLRLWEAYQQHIASSKAADDEGAELEQWLMAYARAGGLTAFRGVDPLAPEKDSPLLPVHDPSAPGLAAAAEAAAAAATVAAAAAVEAKSAPTEGDVSAPRKGPPTVQPGSIKSRKLNRAAAFKNTIASIDAPEVTLPAEAARWLRANVYARFPAWYHRHWNPKGKATAGEVSAAAADAAAAASESAEGWGVASAEAGKAAARERWGAPEMEAGPAGACNDDGEGEGEGGARCGAECGDAEEEGERACKKPRLAAA